MAQKEELIQLRAHNLQGNIQGTANIDNRQPVGRVVLDGSSVVKHNQVLFQRIWELLYPHKYFQSIQQIEAEVQEVANWYDSIVHSSDEKLIYIIAKLTHFIEVLHNKSMLGLQHLWHQSVGVHAYQGIFGREFWLVVDPEEVESVVGTIKDHSMVFALAKLRQKEGRVFEDGVGSHDFLGAEIEEFHFLAYFGISLIKLM